MAEGNRTIEPGEGRLAAAARAGHFARSDLLPAGAALCGAALSLVVLGGGAAHSLVSLFGSRLRDALTAREEPGAAFLRALHDGIAIAAPLVLVPFALALVLALAPVLRSRRGLARTVVPLPSIPKARLEKVALRGLALAIFVATAAAIGRSSLGTVARLVAGDSSALSELFSTLGSLLGAAGGLCLMAGLAELLLATWRFRRALALTPEEQRREQAEAGGDPSTKEALRRRARQA